MLGLAKRRDVVHTFVQPPEVSKSFVEVTGVRWLSALGKSREEGHGLWRVKIGGQFDSSSALDDIEGKLQSPIGNAHERMAPAALPNWNSAVFGALDKSAFGHGGASLSTAQAQCLLVGLSVVGHPVCQMSPLISPAQQVPSSAAVAVALL